MRIKFCFLGLGLALAACSEKPAADQENGSLTSNDFEHYEGWVGDLPLAALSRAQAHSGQFSTFVGPNQEYSLGYSSILSKLSANRPKKYQVKAWVYLPARDAAARLVAEIKDPAANKSLSYTSLELPKEVKSFGSWQPVSMDVDVPVDANSNSKIIIYLWRSGSQQPVYLDDMEIKQIQ